MTGFFGRPAKITLDRKCARAQKRFITRYKKKDGRKRPNEFLREILKEILRQILKEILKESLKETPHELAGGGENYRHRREPIPLPRASGDRRNKNRGRVMTRRLYGLGGKNDS